VYTSRLRTSVATATIAAAIVSLLALVACKPVEITNGAGTGGGAGAGAPGARMQLSELTVAAPASMSGYSRDRFPHWINQGNDCDTRDVVLKRQGKGVVTGAGCKITSGTWTSPYDGKSYNDPLDLDVDHVVPLAAAWRSGASKWTDEKRTEFANDLTRPQLIAVGASINRSKGDQDPSTWRPPLHSYWCQYAQDWIEVKAFWGLSVTGAEEEALIEMLNTCQT
jgi:hypothetical protein